ncbi:hypothetical protein AM499_02215 [Bacillus sp. FJAT-22090]|uniref:DUF2207 domain-containing protein n=1 Tax=Bacillus sp. FJAT-22090 TaxID=1581038 RepID=UPI0006ADC2AB|nr:DUF2207 domain-containing protein [Bacillus sp. FJAT-22090]ALC84761.1 hypothetical protein AM499_02215 [Bacillus sp. FJAT-22090]
MKKMISTIVLFIMMFSFSVIAEAKSYSIESVHIKSWIQPNGDLLVNEVFTYNFDGEFNNLSRSFPKIHDNNVINFYAYELSQLKPEPGFIDDATLKQLNVSKENGVYRTKVNKENQQVSFLYVYTLKNSIKAYDSYSEAKITYFEDVDAHDQNINNVTIDFILPSTTDTSNFDGVLFDRNAKKNEKSQYGIRFNTSVSEAYTETKTSFFFPSTLMTNMEKTKASIPLQQAIANEKRIQKETEKRISYIDKLHAIIPKATIGILIIVLLLFLLPQRHFWRKGSKEDVMNTDLLYLYFVDRVGNPHPKAFLAGLFSMVEKGAATVRQTKAALRFKEDSHAPKETLDFRLVKGSLASSDFEKQMINWLFTTRSGSSKWAFHLHDAAGAARNNKTSSYFHGRVKDFKKKQMKWHRLVESDLEEAGTFNSKLPLIILSISTIVLATMTAFSYYADLRSSWGIGFILAITFLFLIILWLKKRSNLYFCIYIIIMYFSTTPLVNDQLVNTLVNLLLMFTVLYIVLPRNILSMNAVRAKDAIRSFKSSIKLGIPGNLSDKEQEKWVVRAYLLGRKNEKKVSLQEISAPLAALLLTSTDPLDYVTQSWKWTKVASSDGTSWGGASSGGSGGGSDGGGGGAGAD